MSYESGTPYGFYYVDREYIEALASRDEHVPKCDYEDESRSRKFYCGPVTHEDGVDYFVPVSHQIKGNMVIQGSRYDTGVTEYYGTSITDSNHNKTGNLDFRFMIPVVNTEYLTPFEPKGFSAEQNTFCQKYRKTIQNIAHQTYSNIKTKNYDFLNESAIDHDNALLGAFDYDDEYTEQIESGQKKETARQIALRKARLLASSNLSNIVDKQEIASELDHPSS